MYVLKMVLGVDVKLCCDIFIDFDTQDGYGRKWSFVQKCLK